MLNKQFGEWEVIAEAEKRNGAMTWLCKCKCGYTRTFTTSYLNTNQATCCDFCKMQKRTDEDELLKEKYLNTKHGTWTVVSYKGKNKYGSREWMARCECGNERKFLTAYLSGNGKRSATICKTCELRHLEISNRIIHEIPNRFWDKLINNSCRRNIDFKLTKEEAFDVYLKQKGKCALTGIDLYFTKLRTNFNRYTNASIDRINSDLSYSADNIQWVEKRINMMKQKYEQSEFIGLCKLVAENYKMSI